VVLEDVRWDALKAVVDFAYTGSVLLAGSTVVAIIQAANLRAGAGPPGAGPVPRKMHIDIFTFLKDKKKT
jgi:hypothetical protein